MHEIFHPHFRQSQVYCSSTIPALQRHSLRTWAAHLVARFANLIDALNDSFAIVEPATSAEIG